MNQIAHVIVGSLVSFFAFMSFGCSSNANEESKPSEPITKSSTITVHGVAVDGYLVGATVCVDENFNGACDTTEPTTITEADGTFHFEALQTATNKLLPILVSGGKDSATQKAFSGTLKTIIDPSLHQNEEVVTVSILTDVIATLYLNSSAKDAGTLEQIIQTIIASLHLTKKEIFTNPLTMPKLYAKSMEIQQIKRMLETLLATQTSLTQQQIENTVIQAVSKQMSTHNDLNSTFILASLESTHSFTVPTHLRAFVLAQLQTIVDALQPLALKESSKEALLTQLQIELEKIDAKTSEKITSAESNATIPTIAVNTLTDIIEERPTIPIDAVQLADINATITVNSSTKIDTGIPHTSHIELFSAPKQGTATLYLVGGEVWNIDYNTTTCQSAHEQFIIKKDANEYATVNITIQGANTLDEHNRTVTTKENLPLFKEPLSSALPVEITTPARHGVIYPYFNDSNGSSFNYFPNKNFSGTDSFEYSVSQTVNECEMHHRVTVTINVEPVAPVKVATVFPDENGTCKVVLTDGNSSLLYTNDAIYGGYCTEYGNQFFYKVKNKFLYQQNTNTLHAVNQDGSISDINSDQRNRLKTSEVYANNFINWKPYVHKGYKRDAFTSTYEENFIFGAYTSAYVDNGDIQEPVYGLLPWLSVNGSGTPEPLFDFVGDHISGDELITTSFAEINDNIYFLGYDGDNGNGISLACAGAYSPISDDCQGIQLYLNDYDSDARSTSLSFENNSIVSVLDKTLLFTYTHGLNDPKTKLFISDGSIDYFDSDTIKKHLKLISDNEYASLELQTTQNPTTVFYKGKNLLTNKIEIGYIHEEEPLGPSNIRFLKPNKFILTYACNQGFTGDACYKGLQDRTFTMKKRIELDQESKLVAIDNSHIYFTDYNATSNGDLLYHYNNETNTITSVPIAFLNINKTRVSALQVVGNYLYVLTRTTSTDYPISLWKVDPTTNEAVKIESHTILEKKYIRLSSNAFNHGNSILYSVAATNPNDNNDFNDFLLYSYDAQTQTKTLLKQVSHSLQY